MISDPMEKVIADALDKAGIAYADGADNPARLDFYVPQWGLYIEVKRMHSPRIAEQMSRADNVIALQGEASVRLFADLIARAVTSVDGPVKVT